MLDHAAPDSGGTVDLLLRTGVCTLGKIGGAVLLWIIAWGCVAPTVGATARRSLSVAVVCAVVVLSAWLRRR